MRLTTTAVLLLRICMAAVPGACAQTSMAVITAEAKPADDRVQQKITYEAEHKPLKAILADLTKTTGVTLRAGYNARDWQVRDRKMTLHVKDLPLASLMSSIARVMKFKWSVNDQTAPPTYRLIMDRKMLAGMEAEQSKLQADLHAEIVAQRQRCVAGLAKAANMTDSEAEQLRKDSPYLYLCRKTGFANVATQVFAQIPGLKDTYVSANRNIDPMVSLLSPETQQTYIDAIKGFWPYFQVWRGFRSDLPADFESHIPRTTMGMENQPRPFTDWRLGQLVCQGGLGSGTSLGFFHVGAFYDPASDSANAWAEAQLESVEQGRDPRDRDTAAWAKVNAADVKAVYKTFEYLVIDPPSEHPDEADLHKKIKIQIDAAKDLLQVQTVPCAQPGVVFRATQRAVAKATGFNVVSDSFAYMQGDYAAPRDETEMRDVLDSIGKAYFYNWEKHGSVLEFRHRDWFHKRGSQIPDEWVEKWRNILLKKGTLTLEEYVPLATLSFEQLEENVGPDPLLSCCTNIRADQWNLVNNWALLRLYSCLDATQRAQMFTPEGLDMTLLGTDQWQRVVEVFTFGKGFSWGTEGFLKVENRPALTATVKNLPGGQVDYTFIAATIDNKNQKKWRLTLPTYTPPKPEKQSGANPLDQKAPAQPQ